MAKIIKDIYVEWDWSGDEFAVKGFNVAITPSSSDPKNEIVAITKTSADKTDILGQGSIRYEHIFRELALDDTQNYSAWVQAIYEGEDGNWESQNEIQVSDDGSNTIANTKTDNNPITAAGGNITFGGNNNGIIIKDSNDNTTFEATYNGDISLDGTINSNSGFIGGWSINSDALKSTNITLDSNNELIYVGAGNYNKSDTPFYVDGSSNNFSLGQKLNWNGNDLNISGKVVADEFVLPVRSV